MAAMTSRFNIRCVIQYYSDQWYGSTLAQKHHEFLNNRDNIVKHNVFGISYDFISMEYFIISVTESIIHWH